ncbi:hypothetical protein TSAR_009881 [Trichomalopsis sarcophagae]|uniref:Uncharacterized protein n=1 Tax=Trichomalopsis sarcophagae TaxID=543379 RepID=A0A232EJ39_9HYME|nr:hypothetical protein TSAR_009881 [Trichomalopsis sarcophagae]
MWKLINHNIGARGVFVSDGGPVRHQSFLSVFWPADHEFRGLIINIYPPEKCPPRGVDAAAQETARRDTKLTMSDSWKSTNTVLCIELCPEIVASLWSKLSNAAVV